MAKKASNRSVYLTDETWSWIADIATLRGISVSAAVQALIDELRPTGRAYGADPGADPGAPEKTRTPAASKLPDPAPAHWPQVSIGPATPKPGSRLKKVRGA